MLNISDFFEKFRKIDREGTLKQGAILETLEKTLSIKIPANTISIKNGVLIVQGSPLLKSELFLKKEELLKALQSFNIIDIR